MQARELETEAECLGACGDAPMLSRRQRDGDEYYENLTRQSVHALGGPNASREKVPNQLLDLASQERTRSLPKSYGWEKDQVELKLTDGQWKN
jgi:(2Fe-2S) ferredoxin